MRAYAKDQLGKFNKNFRYIELKEVNETKDIFGYLNTDQIKEVFVFDVCDFILEKRLTSRSNSTKNIDLKFIPSPGFFLNKGQVDEFFSNKTKYSFSQFYKSQRQRMNILVNPDLSPVGGKWSYDELNRQKLPLDIKLPKDPTPLSDPFVNEAKNWVEANFPSNPGSLEAFIWPISQDQANHWLQNFIDEKINNFGPYEDAISSQSALLFHSGLASSLNIGLLSPDQCLEAVLKSYQDGQAPLASVEGFIRQIIGWREYMRGLYVARGTTLRNSNKLQNERKLNYQWWQASTGLEPLDDVINKLDNYAYAHHIERLMIAGNLMLLSDIAPNEVYDWFMALFIDAYDWVMVPNVYGMSQYSDLGSMVTKPYISGSNYVLKMSRYKKGQWSEIWDGLFWRFVNKHQELLRSNHRSSMMVRNFNKFSPEKRAKLLKDAEDFLKRNTKL